MTSYLRQNSGAVTPDEAGKRNSAPGLAPQTRYPCAALPSAPSFCAVWAVMAAFWAVMVCRRRQNGESPEGQDPLPALLRPVAS